MKHIIKNIALCGSIILGMGMVSCEDMMTVDTGDKAYVNANDTLYSYLGIMRAMQDVAERQVILGEIRGDLVSSTEYTTDTLHAISNFDNPKDQSCSMLKVSDYYNVINNCNFYIYNCDTSAVKSNVKYMVPEYAQVKAIRAWAYLQLVKNYKEVPYITEPVKSLDVIKNFDYNNNLVNKDNLVDKFKEEGLFDLVNVSYPGYGTTSEAWGKWNNGYTDISARLCYVPIRVVIGDAYLLRGNSKSDYENAALYYYNFLKNETTPMYRQFCIAMNTMSGTTSSASLNGWGEWASVYTYTASSNEVVTTIPGSANAGLGKMLTRVADIYGFTTTSSQSNNEETETDDNGDEVGTGSYKTSGAISVNPTYKRQYCPSNAYEAVNNRQTYVDYIKSNNVTTMSSIKNCDARYNASLGSVSYEGESYPLCGKAASSRGQFYYCIPVYRKSLIWLRLAEAINRAGYPEFAFAILKDGINQYTLPVNESLVRYQKIPTTGPDGGIYYTAIEKINGNKLYIDTVAGSKTFKYVDADGNFTVYPESPTSGQLRYNQDTIRYQQMNYGSIGAMYYVTDSTHLSKFNSFLNFKDDVWNNTYGIHAKGAGMNYRMGRNTFVTWDSEDGGVTTSLTGQRDTVFYDYSKMLLSEGVNLASATEDQIINAVENIIVDELALETAFEGNRFTDLVRIAEHKNNSGFNGTDWLAKKIANRGSKDATETSAAVSAFNADIYSKLQNTSNWYFTLPAWK